LKPFTDSIKTSDHTTDIRLHPWRNSLWVGIKKNYIIIRITKIKRELMMGNKMKLSMLALLATFFFTAGCSRVTQENYDKLKTGMEYGEVTALMGIPDNCTESMGAKSCIWGNETKNIKVGFLSDQTMVFSSTGIK